MAINIFARYDSLNFDTVFDGNNSYVKSEETNFFGSEELRADDYYRVEMADALQKKEYEERMGIDGTQEAVLMTEPFTSKGGDPTTTQFSYFQGKEMQDSVMKVIVSTRGGEVTLKYEALRLGSKQLQKFEDAKKKFAETGVMDSYGFVL